MESDKQQIHFCLTILANRDGFYDADEKLSAMKFIEDNGKDEDRKQAQKLIGIGNAVYA